jgi:hypothetical protein
MEKSLSEIHLEVVEEADKYKRLKRAKGNFETKVIHLNQKPEGTD